jgi:putative oxidoreductase
MTTGTIDEKRLIFPSLAGLYKTFSPASYSFMRFATGAVLIPHGIQKIMLGSAANLATVIDKQMGVSYPLIWAYFAIFAESVGAICLAVGLFTRMAALIIWIEMGFIIVFSNGNSATSGLSGVMNMRCCGGCSASRSSFAAADGTPSIA